MELRHLRYFAAVASTLNFRKAAERLHVSSPALSKQVKDLEDEIGVQLFRRDTTAVHLTHAGEIFRNEVVRILAETEQAVALAQQAARGQRGKLVVGNIGLLTADTMSACLTRFLAQSPEVEVQLIDLDIPQQMKALENGSIHLAFLPAHSLGRMPSRLRSEPVLTMPLLVAMAASHCCARLKQVTLADLENETVLAVGVGESSTHGEYMRSLWKTGGYKSAHVVQVQGIESLLAMLASGQGVSIFAGRGSHLQREGIAVRPFRDKGPPFCLELHAVWREDSNGSLARKFIEIFRNLGRLEEGSNDLRHSQ